MLYIGINARKSYTDSPIAQRIYFLRIYGAAFCRHDLYVCSFSGRIPLRVPLHRSDFLIYFGFEYGFVAHPDRAAAF